MFFWVIAVIFVLVGLGAVAAPLMRGAGRGARRASYDMQVYRDQLREVEGDLARGVLNADEAEASRTEISRRLLAAADDEAAERATGSAPQGFSRIMAAVLVLGAGLMAIGLYAVIGAPGLRDQPLAGRQAPPDQTAIIAQLQDVLTERPNDIEGHRLLARSLAGVGRFGEAQAALARVVVILGENAAAGDHLALAQLTILAADGRVTPEAEAALVAALEKDPDLPLARYYSGLGLVQQGRADLAFPVWSRLLSEGPPDAPWVQAIADNIDEVARLAGEAPPAVGPSREEIDAAGEMTDGERAAMISSMVDGLSARLADEGGPPGDWARLITSLGVLGRTEEAAAIRDEAREAFAGDAAALAEIDAAGRAAGLDP